MSMKQALQNIERNGGKINGNEVTIICQQPQPVRYEKAFEGIYPIAKKGIHKSIGEVPEFSFEGTGIVMKGGVSCKDVAYVAKVEVYIDGKLIEIANLPANYTTRRHELFWSYQLSKGKHVVSFKWLNPQPTATIRLDEAVIYTDAS